MRTILTVSVLIVFAITSVDLSFCQDDQTLEKMAVDEGYVKDDFLKGLDKVNDYLQDLCRRTMFKKVKQGFRGPHKMPCWLKVTRDN